ncbi:MULTISPECIES: hypothetical protein [Paenibacillus]|nr:MULTISPECIES: hypothetical protein [Paenibacillus]
MISLTLSFLRGTSVCDNTLTKEASDDAKYEVLEDILRRVLA